MALFAPPCSAASIGRPPPASWNACVRWCSKACAMAPLVLSTGLFYVPATFSKTDEVVELAKVAGASGGIHISHMRDEELGVEDSVRETIAIGEQGGLPTQVTHHKTIGKATWGKTVNTLRQIDEARQRGVDVTLDVYPYTASSTSISAALMPVWAQEGSRDDILKRLRDPVTRRRILVETIRILLEGRGGGDARNVMVSRCDWSPSLAGQRLDDVAALRGKSRSIEDAADAALWLVESGDCGGIYFAIGEEDIQRILRHPASMIASDGGVVLFGRASPHPRSYGTFVRVLGRYVRDLKVLTLEDAIRKMSSFPARRIGLTDRGVLRERMKADIVIFDPADGSRHGDVRATPPVRSGYLSGGHQRPDRIREWRSYHRSSRTDSLWGCAYPIGRWLPGRRRDGNGKHLEPENLRKTSGPLPRGSPRRSMGEARRCGRHTG